MNERVRVLLCSSPAAAVPAALALHGEKAKTTSFTNYKNVQKVIQAPLVLKVSLKNARGKKKRKEKRQVRVRSLLSTSLLSEKCPRQLEFQNLSVS